MFDFSFGELAIIGAVALVVLGPERLPRVARTAGQWIGKAQRYVNDVKADIQREAELAELKKLHQQVQTSARELETSMQQGLTSIESEFRHAKDALHDVAESSSAHAAIDEAMTPSSYDRTHDDFVKPVRSVEELSEHLVRLEQRLNAGHAGDSHAPRFRYAPRARAIGPRRARRSTKPRDA